jgi:hypothetical protein
MWHDWEQEMVSVYSLLLVYVSNTLRETQRANALLSESSVPVEYAPWQ